jgi:hypothetical protein
MLDTTADSYSEITSRFRSRAAIKQSEWPVINTYNGCRGGVQTPNKDDSSKNLHPPLRDPSKDTHPANPFLLMHPTETKTLFYPPKLVLSQPHLHHRALQHPRRAPFRAPRGSCPTSTWLRLAPPVSRSQRGPPRALIIWESAAAVRAGGAVRCVPQTTCLGGSVESGRTRGRWWLWGR